MIDYSKILNELKEATLFDIYRLVTALERELENPNRINKVRKKLTPGQKITYFDRKENKLIEAVVIELKRTRLLVEHIIDNTRWDIPFHWVNMYNVNTDIYDTTTKKGLHKNEIKIGDIVSFKNQQNQEIVGKVLRLNTKTVTIKTDNMHWRVAYSLLSPVIDIDSSIATHNLEGTIIDI